MISEYISLSSVFVVYSAVQFDVHVRMSGGFLVVNDLRNDFPFIRVNTALVPGFRIIL